MKTAKAENGTYLLNLDEANLGHLSFESRNLLFNGVGTAEIEQCFLIDILLAPLPAYAPNYVMENRHNFLSLNLVISHLLQDLS